MELLGAPAKEVVEVEVPETGLTIVVVALEARLSMAEVSLALGAVSKAARLTLRQNRCMLPHQGPHDAHSLWTSILGLVQKYLHTRTTI